MPGDPTAFLTGSPGLVASPASNPAQVSSGASHWGFIFWLVVLGVVIPVAILGGLQIGGFSFVFRHR